MTVEDRRALADDLLAVKRAVYVDTLRDLAESHGYEAPSTIQLSAEVERALRDEATEHAALMVRTFNDELAEFLERNRDLDERAVVDLYGTWATDRWEKRAEQIAVTESYGPHADASLSFYADNGLEPDYEFGIHAADDQPPECELCQALMETNPHPGSRVLEVGIPHIGCRQSWEAVGLDPEQLPEELRIGQSVAGIVGAEPLNMTLGGTSEAVEAVRSMTEG